MEYTLITGACGGLGKEFCRQLIKSEDLFLTGRNEEKLLKLKQELSEINPQRKTEIFKADLTDEKERENLFLFADEKGITFSGYIGVAGADIQKEFLMRRAEKLKILTVSSMSGSTPMPYFAIYSATKAALINFYTSLRYEVKNANITILVPGGIPTRADVIQDIERQGVTGKLSSKPAEFVVRKALKGLEKNKRLVIPGAFNKFVYGIEKIAPMPMRCRFVAKKWKQKEKDAF